VELLVRLRRADVEAEVLTSSYRGLASGSFRDIPVHRFRYAPARYEDLTHDEAAADRVGRALRYRVLAVAYLAAGSLAALRLARRRGYDVIHVHWPVPNAVLGLAARLGRRAPTVSTFYSLELRLGGTSKPVRSLIRWTVTSPQRVVAISTATAAALRELAPVPVEVIPYSLPAMTVPERTRPRGGTFQVLFVGRLVARKGVDVLLRARAAQRTVRPVELVICGGGPEREALEALAAQLGIAHDVRFEGRVSDERLHEAYAEADAFVLPAVIDARGDSEGLGVVLLEAMSAGVPVVASATGGIVDIVADGAGLTVPPGDPEALAAALDRLADDDEVAAALAEAGRARLAGPFAWDGIVERWLAVYRSVVR
jgi:glycosyltransferase involved in cell wall biosynthesis